MLSSSVAAMPPLPLLGVTVAYLNAFVEEHGVEGLAGLTTDDVMRKIVQPLTATTKLSLCAHLQTTGRPECVGRATWFISHAWKYLFLDVVDAITSFFVADNPTTAGQVIVWFDMFSVPQHDLGAAEKDFAWWTNVFRSAIGDMHNVLMVMLPWNNPITLTRAWCVFEVYSCQSTGSRFEVAMTGAERNRFINMIVDNSNAYFAMLATINTQNSECFHACDRDRIFEAIRNLVGGFELLDSLVLKVIEQWMVSSLRKMITACEEAGNEGMAIGLSNSLATIEYRQGHLETALDLYRDTVSRARALWGAEDGFTLAYSSNLALVLAAQGKYAEALPLCEESLSAMRRTGQDEALLMTTLQNLGYLYASTGRFVEAERAYLEALEGRSRVLGDQHIDTLATKNNLALLYQAMGRYEDALVLYQQLVDVSTRNEGPSHPNTLTYTNNLCILLNELKRFNEAETLLLDLHLIQRRVLGEDHPDTINSANNLGLCYFNQRRYDEAGVFFDKCYAYYLTNLGPEHPLTLVLANNVANQHSASGDVAGAIAILGDLVETKRRVLGANHPDTLLTMANLATALIDSGHYDSARMWLEQCVRIGSEALGERHPTCLMYMHSLGIAYYRLGKYDSAVTAFDQCLRLRVAVLGADHASTLDTAAHLKASQRRASRCCSVM